MARKHHGFLIAILALVEQRPIISLCTEGNAKRIPSMICGPRVFVDKYIHLQQYVYVYDTSLPVTFKVYIQKQIRSI